MSHFNRTVEDTSSRVNQTVAEAAECLERETADFVKYLNDEVIPAVR